MSTTAQIRSGVSVFRRESRAQLGASHADSMRSGGQCGADASTQALGSGGAFPAAPCSVETSIDALAPAAARVDRLGEVDYLRQAVGDL